MALDELDGGVGEFVGRELDVEVVGFRRFVEPLEVVVPPEDRGAVVGVVDTDPSKMPDP